jgi:hypothetical protein
MLKKFAVAHGLGKSGRRGFHIGAAQEPAIPQPFAIVVTEQLFWHVCCSLPYGFEVLLKMIPSPRVPGGISWLELG